VEGNHRLTFFSSWPVFALSQDVGTIMNTANPVVWAIGYTHDPAVVYTDLDATKHQRSLYYVSKYSDSTSLASSIT
jgi:hypothetical protein